MLRSRRVRLGGAVTILGLLIAMVPVMTNVGAVINGEAQSSAPTFVADIRSPAGFCSGIVIANGWILTAAHCFPPADDGTVSPAGVQVKLGGTNGNSGVVLNAVQVDVPETAIPGYGGDVALIEVSGFDPYRWDAVPLAFETSVIDGAGGITAYGYGATQLGSDGVSPAKPGLLRKTPDGAYERATSCDGFDGTLFACLRPTSTATVGQGAPSLMHGDSGASILRWKSGAWQSIGVFDVTLGGVNVNLPAPIAGFTSVNASGPGEFVTIRDWIRAVTRMPTVAAGTIVRNPQTGASWMVEPDGYRNWIPTGGDYLCFTGEEHPVQNMTQTDIDTIPDRVGTHATCTPGSPTPPPSTFSETVGGRARTWTNYTDAGGTQGPTIAAFTTVQVTCKVQGFAVRNGNNWWYQIASSPWNNAYYVSADAFYNNGRTSGSLRGTPFVDNNVPNCSSVSPVTYPVPVSIAPPSESIQIGWSSAHPGWISMTLNGFPTGSYSYSCDFGSGGDQSFTLTETSDPQTFDNGQTCYDQVLGDTVWVTIGSVQSNTITVPSSGITVG